MVLDRSFHVERQPRERWNRFAARGREALEPRTSEMMHDFLCQR
jgi:hypothetical protein